MQTSIKTILFIIGLGFCAEGSAVPTTFIWEGSTNSSMNLGSNWNQNQIPNSDGENDTLVFPSGSPTNVNNDIPGTLLIGDISIDSSYTITGNAFGINIPSSSPDYLGSYTLTFSSENASINVPVILNGTWVVTSTATPGNSIDGQITGTTTGNLNLLNGFLKLGASNIYSGVLTVGNEIPLMTNPAAYLQATAANAFGGIGFNTVITVSSTATLDLNDFSSGVGTLSGPDGSSVMLGGGTLTVNSGSAQVPFYGVISGTNGNVIVNAGGLALMGANTYSGSTEIQNGGHLDSLDHDLGMTSGVTFSNGGGSLVVGQSGTSGKPYTFSAVGKIGVPSPYTLTLNGTLTGASSLIKDGPGTLVLAGTNNNTGDIHLWGGTLNINSLGSVQGFTFDSPSLGIGTLQFGFQPMSPITQSFAFGLPGIIDTNGNDITIDAAITGGHYLVKTGEGTLSIPYSGNIINAKTKISEGTLNVMYDGYSTVTQTVFSGLGTGTLQIGENFTVADNTAFAMPIVFMADGTIDTQTYDMEVTNVIAGWSTGNTFHKRGAGTLTLSGNNIYQAATHVHGGVLQAGIASSTTYGPFGLSSAITVDSTGTLDFQSYETTVGSLSNSGTILSSNTVDASSFSQDGTGTLSLDFSEATAKPHGNISTTGIISLNGTLDVKKTGDFPHSSGEFKLLQSSGSGKQLSGTFSSTNLAFGKLKYDYSQNQVLLGVGGCDATWTAATNGDWALVGNWSGCVPGIHGNTQDSATFNDVAAGTVTVTLADSGGSSALPVTLHDMKFNASTTTFTIDQFDATSVITLNAPSGISSPTIHVTAGTPTIDAPILLSADSVFSLSNGTLNLGSNASITSANAEELQIIEGQSSGTLANTGSITPSSLKVNGSSINNSGTIQTSGSIVVEGISGLVSPITIDNSGTFIAGTTLTIGDQVTFTNSGTLNSGGNFTISGGVVNNQSSGEMLNQSGSNNTLSITGGSLTNSQAAGLGTFDLDLSISGGSMNTSDIVRVNNYTQTSDGTLILNFPIASDTLYGTVGAAAQYKLDGTLNVTNTGGFTPDSGTEIILLGSGGSGKQLFGAFSTTNLAFGKLKYDYSQKNQVILKVGDCDGIWTAATDGNWETNGNWSGCVPGVGGNNHDSATFNDVAAGAITVRLANDAGNAGLSVTLHEIDFSSASTIYTIEQFDNTSSITLDKLGTTSKPFITLTAGTATIDAPITLNTDSVLSVSSGTLIFGSNTTITGSHDLQINEGNTSGTIRNHGTMTPESLTIEGNTFHNLGSVQTAGPIVIEELSGVDNPIVLNNLSTFLAGTNLSVSGNAMITNQTGSQMSAGSSGLLSVAGGTVTNSQGAVFGALDADFTMTGGTVNQFGTMMARTYTQSGAATLQLNLLDSSSFGNVFVSHQANLGGNLVVSATSDSSITSGQSFDLITTQNGVSSRFSNVVFQGFPSSSIPDLVYLSNRVQLKTSPAVPGHFSANQSHISFGLVKQHTSYISRKCFQFKNRLPQDSSSVSQDSTWPMDLTSPGVEGMLASLDESSNRDMDPMQESNRKSQKIPAGDRHLRYGRIYMGPVASFGEIASRGDQLGSTYTSAGGLLGTDYLFREIDSFPCNVGLGGIVQYRRLWGEGKDQSGDYQSDILHGSLYSSFIPQSISALSIEAILGYAHVWDHLNRTAGFDRQRTAKSDTDQNLLDALLGSEYAFTLPKQFSCTPYLYLQYIYNHISGAKETGAGIYNLETQSQSIHSLNTQLGARTCYDLVRKSYSLTFELDVEWIREYLNEDRSVGFTPFVITNQPTTVTAFGPSKNSLLLAFDLLLECANGWQVETNYTFQYNSSFFDNFFYLGFGKKF